MGDVEVHSNFTITEKKTKKVKKTTKQRRESSDQQGEVTITEIERTNGTQGGEYTKAMNKDWHGQHFCCWQCDESLTGQRYVLRDEHPYCVSCYESVFANACEKCSRIIGIDSKDLSYKDKHWHEACFLCTTCGESLVDRQFGSKGDRIYCGRCYDEQFASRCDGCHEIFRADWYESAVL
ncbi:LIM domain containing protein [Asbolus verrucosus]|uniref:LIM domain containing protein n=1 Tax=Asbolus verrucosus TaxID=1661398 RepID=A0A482WDU9_ASBVE|nr:LIM domain containing protein [Asbolus verrucosus]